jgi:hypothetical protein
MTSLEKKKREAQMAYYAKVMAWVMVFAIGGGSLWVIVELIARILA